MKRLILGVVLLSGLLFSDCRKKNPSVNPILYVMAIDNKFQPVANPTVYLKSGGAHNPLVPLSQYEQQAQGDAYGLAIFTDVAEGDYFVHIEAVVSGTKIVRGEEGVSLIRKRAPNRYEKKIIVQ